MSVLYPMEGVTKHVTILTDRTTVPVVKGSSYLKMAGNVKVCLIFFTN